MLQQGRGAPSPPCRVPRAAPGTASVPASHGQRQGLGLGMLLQKSRLRRRALSQPPGPWPSLGEAPGRDRLCSVVFGTGFTLRAPGMNQDGYKGDFPSRKQSLPQTMVEPPFWTLCMDGFLSVCPEVVFHCRLGVGRERGTQPKHTGGLSSICGQEFPIFLFMSRLAPEWGRPEKFVQTFKIKDT